MAVTIKNNSFEPRPFSLLPSVFMSVSSKSNQHVNLGMFVASLIFSYFKLYFLASRSHNFIAAFMISAFSLTPAGKSLVSLNILFVFAVVDKSLQI